MKPGSALLAIALGSLACDRQVPGASAAASSAPSAPGAPSASGAPSVSSASSASSGALASIPAACATPRVIIATVAANTENHYAWTATRQAVLASPGFHVVSHGPEAPGEIYFRQIEDRQNADGKEPRRTLVAYCKDGETCNHFAAMHRAVVRSSHPQPMCGIVPGESDNYQIVDFQWNGAQGDLPRNTDIQAQCARLGACLINADPATPGDPIRECQEAPSKWKTRCALQRTCAEVVACLGP